MQRDRSLLTLGVGVREDLLDALREAHVEHAVDLVEDDVVDAAEVERAARAQVEDAAGRADDDIDPPAHRVRWARQRDESERTQASGGRRPELTLSS